VQYIVNDAIYPQPQTYLVVFFTFCVQAFEHLIHRELICFTDNRGQSLSVEFRPVKLLISSAELHQGLRANTSCPVS